MGSYPLMRLRSNFLEKTSFPHTLPELYEYSQDDNLTAGQAQMLILQNWVYVTSSEVDWAGRWGMNDNSLLVYKIADAFGITFSGVLVTEVVLPQEHKFAQLIKEYLRATELPEDM